MDITKDEYILLEQFYNVEKFKVNNDLSAALRSKGLLDYFWKHQERSGEEKHSDELKITNDGKIAYEQYRERTRIQHNVSVRSWVSIIISGIALSISITQLILRLVQ